jgi:predicted ATPase
LFPAALWFASLLRGGVAFFDPSWEALRRPAPPGHPTRLIHSGENLPWLALDLKQSAPDRFAAWVDHVRTALPQVREIEPREREEDHYAYFSVGYNGGYTVTSSGLSDGTLRILALSILPFLSDEAMPRLLVTEEPENGIHPRAIETVVQSLSIMYDSQVWVSTHSPIVLAHTELPCILATRLNADGSVSVVAGDKHPRLRDWQGTLDIGTLFAAGVLS